MPLNEREFDEENMDNEDESVESPAEAESGEEEEDHKFYNIEYKCEDCDYLWREKQKAHLNDENSDDERWVIDETNMACPICGSNNISRI